MLEPIKLRFASSFSHWIIPFTLASAFMRLLLRCSRISMKSACGFRLYSLNLSVHKSVKVTYKFMNYLCSFVQAKHFSR